MSITGPRAMKRQNLKLQKDCIPPNREMQSLLFLRQEPVFSF